MLFPLCDRWVRTTFKTHPFPNLTDLLTDLSVEGIFRKNGNIRRLKELTDAIDRDPQSVDLTQDNAVQLAALLKKFLRDLPDPLLTVKLHRLFIASQSGLLSFVNSSVADQACSDAIRARSKTLPSLHLHHFAKAKSGHHGSPLCFPQMGRIIRTCRRGNWK